MGVDYIGIRQKNESAARNPYLCYLYFGLIFDLINLKDAKKKWT